MGNYWDKVDGLMHDWNMDGCYLGGSFDIYFSFGAYIHYILYIHACKKNHPKQGCP